MKLIFQGHDYRYAVEQSLLAFFPNERPVYDGEEDTNTAQVTLMQADALASAVTVLSVDGKRSSGESSLDISGATLRILLIKLFCQSNIFKIPLIF